MFLLYFILSIRLPAIDQNKIFNSLTKILANSCIAGLVAYAMLNLLSSIVNMHTFLGILSQGLGAALVALLSYVLLSILLRLEEVDIVRRILIKFWLFLRNGKY